MLKKRLLEIAAPYLKKLASKLASATHCLFTFLPCGGIEPANNSAGRGIRSLALHCRIRGQIGSKKMSGFAYCPPASWHGVNRLNFYLEVDRILQIHA